MTTISDDDNTIPDCFGFWSQHISYINDAQHRCQDALCSSSCHSEQRRALYWYLCVCVWVFSVFEKGRNDVRCSILCVIVCSRTKGIEMNQMQCVFTCLLVSEFYRTSVKDRKMIHQNDLLAKTYFIVRHLRTELRCLFQCLLFVRSRNKERSENEKKNVMFSSTLKERQKKSFFFL